MSTIAAISTAPAIGGIGIVRMSGEKCFDILEKIFVQKKSTKNRKYKRLYYKVWENYRY